MIKKYILPIRGRDRVIYDLIKSSEKKVETRAGGPKYKDIQKGDVIVFKCGKNKFQRKVIRVKKFKSIDSMLKHYKPSDIDPRVKSAKELKKMYHSFPGYIERLKKYGIIAFEIVK